MSKKKYLDGFDCLNVGAKSELKYYPVAIGVAISKNDALILTAGYVQLATTLATELFIGIAASSNTAAEAVANGTVKAAVIPPEMMFRFRVPVEATDLITLAQVGAQYDLQTEDGIDEGDVANTLGWGFFVDAIDVTADAILINTFGYAIGHFRRIAAS